MIQGEFTRHGHIEHRFVALDSISIILVKVKRDLATGKGKLNVKAQFLTKAAGRLKLVLSARNTSVLKFIACERANRQQGLQVAVPAILVMVLASNIWYMIVLTKGSIRLDSTLGS